jgi:hypothetical protein
MYGPRGDCIIEKCGFGLPNEFIDMVQSILSTNWSSARFKEIISDLILLEDRSIT